MLMAASSFASFLRVATALIVGQPSRRSAGSPEGRAAAAAAAMKNNSKVNGEKKREVSLKSGGFQMPLHYPRFNKEDYEKMEEWRVDALLREYGLTCDGCIEEKRKYAMGAFLWPDQL